MQIFTPTKLYIKGPVAYQNERHGESNDKHYLLECRKKCGKEVKRVFGGVT